MKKRILAVVLACVMVISLFSSVTLAAEKDNAIDVSVLGNDPDAMTVKFDGKLNILALGDSVASGYGLEGLIYEEDIAEKAGGFRALPSGAYATVVSATIAKKYGSTNVSLTPGPVCIARTQDVCTLIDDGSVIGESGLYKGDWYFEKLVRGYILKGAKEISKTGDGDYLDINVARQEYQKRIKAADLITISVGGNNFYSYPILCVANKNDSNVSFDNDLSEYFSKSIKDTFELTRKLALAEAKLIDKHKEKKNEQKGSIAAGAQMTEFGDNQAMVGDGEGKHLPSVGEFNLDLSTTTSKVTALFDLLEAYIYSVAANNEALPDLFEMINALNPDAKVIVTGLPLSFGEYKIKVSDKMIIDIGQTLGPIFKVIDKRISSIAGKYRNFVRYVDILDADMIVTDDFENNIVPIDSLEVLLVDDLRASHPSEEGHAFIAKQILKKLKLVNTSNSDSLLTRINSIIHKILKIELLRDLEGGCLISKLGAAVKGCFVKAN